MNNNGITCLTIVSKNYISAARVLCSSFLENHPGARFFVVLVDKLNGEFDPELERFELLTLYDIELPNPDIFPYQYTILELNTAVKPFALKYLLKDKSVEKIAYIDPDILVARSLSHVWGALEDNSIVLTPHMREPFYDNESPTELQILQSGTYNLGFIGLKNNPSSLKLLNWWIEKLYLDCIVDIPNGLFVDQKWMDLIPGYFQDCYILHDPSYNVAYWNLHERRIEKTASGYEVDGEPLSFFHFSGYDPRKSDILSKHQTRHRLIDDPSVEHLFDHYGSKLFEAGLNETKGYVYEYGTLPNGITVSRSIHIIIRHCLKKGIPFPSPENDSDNFCRWLLTPTSNLYGINLPPLFHGILIIRPDVKEHFPGSWHGHNLEGLTEWVQSSGREEENLGPIIDKFSFHLQSINPVRQVYEIYDSRKDLQISFPNLACNTRHFNDFIHWLRMYGKKEESVTDEMIDAVEKSKLGFIKVISLYYLRPDLQVAFPKISADLESYSNWLFQTRLPHISEDEKYTFFGIAGFASKEIANMQIKYNKTLIEKADGPLGLYNFSHFKDIAKNYFGIEPNQVDEYYKGATNPLRELEFQYAQDINLQKKFPDAFNKKSQLEKLVGSQSKITNFKSIFINRTQFKTLKQQLINYQPNHKGINLAGYMDAATGMGQSARSLEHTIFAAGLQHSIRTIPNLHIDSNYFENKVDKEHYFGEAIVGNRVNIIVSNADAIVDSNSFFPKADMVGRRNIGYWVWETEELPQKYKESATDLDEIWTPSEYSARAIRKLVNIPVHVLPHIINFTEIENTVRNNVSRDYFNLPNNTLLFGYFFDQKSILERKNPSATIQAFRNSFGTNNPDVSLVMKVNTAIGGELEYELLKSSNLDLNIIWIEKTLSREKTLALMNCLDVYVSLHRSEGFGLTIAESMALGKPVIATNYSGNVDFMDEESSILVDYNEQITKRDFGPYPKGTVWADPIIHSAEKAMLKCLSSGFREEIGINAEAKIRSTLSPAAIADKLLELLE